jgi:hypothetical protein
LHKLFYKLKNKLIQIGAYNGLNTIVAYSIYLCPSLVPCILLFLRVKHFSEDRIVWEIQV